ncbi:uncharacterized protein LOC111457897 isoform X2 [Cucurbita moschata]|uniref:Uncharacterized protein LOC111457897 isoform X2 n=1 Tax=Cucurbita moschata TaxID=3662 RepID=A0A6J1GWX0_CUCMO|nr:uncharacterized protein LOC111457897 isoform X2 [Cucurbita moschata]
MKNITTIFFILPIFLLSLSHALQDHIGAPLLSIGAQFSESSLQKETLVGFDAMNMRKMGNGRMRVAIKRIMRRESTTNDEREEEEDQESSRISGQNTKRSNKLHQTSQLNHQDTSEAKRWKNSSISKRVSTREEETQRLVKAAREIANLMHKDYKDWGHRKPPINNREPLH